MRCRPTQKGTANTTFPKSIILPQPTPESVSHRRIRKQCDSLLHNDKQVKPTTASTPQGEHGIHTHIRNIVQPKPNVPRSKVSSIMHSPKSPTTTSDPKITAFDQHTSQTHKKDRVVLKGLDRRASHHKKPTHARHFTSAVSSPDYTGKERQG